MTARRKSSPFHVSVSPRGVRSSIKIGGVRVSSSGRISTRVGGVTLSTRLGQSRPEQPADARSAKSLSPRANKIGLLVVWMIIIVVCGFAIGMKLRAH